MGPDAAGTLPYAWFVRLAACLESAFGDRPSINELFRGSYIIRSDASEMPWVQLEISRADFLTAGEKRQRVFEALKRSCAIA